MSRSHTFSMKNMRFEWLFKKVMPFHKKIQDRNESISSEISRDLPEVIHFCMFYAIMYDSIVAAYARSYNKPFRTHVFFESICTILKNELKYICFGMHGSSK